jgi:signal transduction histidine kinase/CheY-like chemotaxis protein/HAMP domain-containing protein
VQQLAKMGLRGRILLLIFLAVAPVFVLDGYETVQLRRLTRGEVERETLRLTGLAADEQRQLSEGSRQLLVALAQLPQVRSLDSTQCNPLFQGLLQQYPIYSNIGVVDAQGAVVCSGVPLTGPATASDRGWFQRALAERSFAAGEYQIGRITGEAAVNFGYPVLGERSSVIGVVFTAMRLSWLNAFAREADLPQDSVVTVFDRQGLVLARWPGGAVGSSLADSPLFAAARGGNDGTLRLTDESGMGRLVGFAPLARGPEGDYAYVAVGVDEGIAFASANDLERTRRTIGFVALLVLVLVVIGSERYVLRPVRALLAATRRFSASDLDARTGLSYNGGELGELAQAFDEMADSRQRAEERIARFNRSLQRRVENRTRDLAAAKEAAEQEHATLASVIASMSDGLLVMDDELHVRYCNARAGELLGIEPASIEGETAGEVFDRIHESFSDPSGAAAAWWGSLTHPDEHPSFEVAMVGPPRRDVRIDLFDVADNPGQNPGVGTLLHDVTGERELNRVKDELVSVVSHELRTPLASLVGFANLLLTRDVAEKQRRQYLGIIADEGHRLTALINDFLDLQRMESGHMEIAPAPVEIRPLFERAVAGAQDTTHAFYLDIPSDLPCVRADPAKLQQVLANLLSNACKYAPDAADIRVSAESMDGQVRVSVADQGLGVPPEALPQLFTKFFRVDNSDRRKIKGTGLGLAICKQIIAAHGGRIWAESEGLGKGTRIFFTLPVATEAPASGDVLIVENDVGFAQLVEAELRAEGLSASRVENAEDGLERIAAEAPRAIVLDLMLPGINGDELLERLRASATAPIPIVVMTVKDLTAEERENLLSLGVSSIVQKGPTSAALAAKTVAMTLAQPNGGREDQAA